MERKVYLEIMHNCQQKIYPDGSATLLISDNKIFREPGWERDKPEIYNSENPKPTDKRENAERALRRARAAVSDYARANKFSYFVTLTLDKEKVDRYDINASLRPLRWFLDNLVRRHGLIYILVPELHKDGAIHFHGLFNDAPVLVDSGTVRLPGSKRPRKPRSKRQREQWLEDGGQVVYNIPGYKLGFSTAIPLYGEYRAAVAYVCKYIGKQPAGDTSVAPQKIGGRWYYSGGNLKKPVRKYIDVDWDDFGGDHSFTIPRLGVQCVKIEVDGELDYERMDDD